MSKKKNRSYKKESDIHSKETEGQLYIISAPSGAGKTSLVKALLEQLKCIEVSVSHTTRKERLGEKDGKDYHFIDATSFLRMIEEGAFLEHAQVFDNFYGTAHASIKKQLKRGKDVILEIDWQGARQVREVIPEALSIFILPPSKKALEERLNGRGQDSKEIIARRMEDAISESSHYGEFDYLIINDQFETALTELNTIVMSQRLLEIRQKYHHQKLLHELLNN